MSGYDGKIALTHFANNLLLQAYNRIHVGPPTAPRTPTQAGIDAVKAGLLSMIAQIEADRKARPVHAAIDATHRGFRSNGRPQFFIPDLGE